jgi:L-ascorbate metabolism protein UlaG (beta-lactamase superfamily)
MIRCTFAGLAGAMLALLTPVAAFATCVPVAGTTPEIVPAAFRTAALPGAGEVRITFLGHASFLLETPGGATAVTDFNGYVRAPEPPTLVTMNNAHSTHYTDVVDPAIEHVLRGWDPGGGIAIHDVKVEDMRVRNVPTNVREFGGTRYNGNSIFVFEVADLCIAHLGHLHHLLSDEHLSKLGVIDILMVPIDGSYTIRHELLAEVIAQINPQVVIPMHYFGEAMVARFVDHLGGGWEVVRNDGATATFSRLRLPWRKLVVLAGY